MAPARCLYCGRWYAVNPRLWGRQETCGDVKCRAKHKAELNRKWRKAHPERQKERNKQVTERRREERYWDKWRSGNPEYVGRNRDDTRERMRRLRVQRKEAAHILEDPVGYLEGLWKGRAEMFATQELIGVVHGRGEGSRPRMFATQESMRELSVGLWTYLKVRAMFATREGVAVSGEVQV